MAKAKTQFLCNSCGSVHPKWMGKCPDCGTWDSLQEYKEPTFDARAERTAGTVARMDKRDRRVLPFRGPPAWVWPLACLKAKKKLVERRRAVAPDIASA